MTNVDEYTGGHSCQRKVDMSLVGRVPSVGVHVCSSSGSGG